MDGGIRLQFDTNVTYEVIGCFAGVGMVKNSWELVKHETAVKSSVVTDMLLMRSSYYRREFTRLTNIATFMSRSCYRMLVKRSFSKGWAYVVYKTLTGAFAQIAKSACYLCPVRPSVYPHISAWLPRNGFLWTLTLETCMGTCREAPNLVKVGQQCRALYAKT
jgi:hypothetical protein